MDLKDKLVSSFMAFENTVDVNHPVHEVRSEAIKNFEALGFPSKKMETWKYTSLKSILKPQLSVFPKKETSLDYKDVKQYFIHEIESYKIVFVDGVYNSHLSETSHEGLDVCLMSAALSKPKYRLLIENYFNKIAVQDGLTSLNTAFSKEGAFINIPRGVVVEKPIQILHLTTGVESSLMTQPRNLVVVGENAHVQIIERHQSLTDNPTFTNSVTEIFANKRGIVDYYKIQNDRDEASLIDNTYISQQRNSHVSVHTFSLGGKLTRNNLQFFHKGEYLDSTLKGVTITDKKQHVDHSTLVHHAQPNCESHQDYKGIYADKSTGVFNGQIIVEKEAQKTNGFQQNNNILLDDTATINAKPQLEIFADDVRCSHGCTIGQLDDEALLYLRSRGIPKKEATALLMFGFANNVLESVKIPQLKQRITKLIAAKLGVDLGFDL